MLRAGRVGMSASIERATASDTEALLALMKDNGLPTDGLADHVATTVVAREDGRLVGSAGLEVYADGALLRSVAVAQDLRSTGLGHRLTDAALALAREQGIGTLFLLTTTAEDYFPKFGFERITRADVPPGVQQSIEFRSACPASAVVMRRRL